MIFIRVGVCPLLSLQKTNGKNGKKQGLVTGKKFSE